MMVLDFITSTTSTVPCGKTTGQFFIRLLNASIYVFAILQFIRTTHAQHWIPTKDDVVHHVPSGSLLSILSRYPSQNMRFHVTFDSSLRQLERAKRDLIMEKLIPESLEYFHKTLKVRPSNLPIRLQQKCRDRLYFLKDTKGRKKGDIIFCKLNCVKTFCGPVEIPDEHLDACRTCDSYGLNCATEKTRSKKVIEQVDFILYVSSLLTEHCTKTNAVAYASYCQQEKTLNRPVAGFANICPHRIEPDSLHYSSLLATIKHEIFHALGFSAGLYAFYRDSSGRPLTPRNALGLPRYNNKTNLFQWSQKVVRKIVRKDWETVNGMIQHDVLLIVTPTVKREVRKHFRCNSLEGAEIENQGFVGTRSTHWEKRLFENEAMTGTYTQNPVFSRITLALMEDTGWYRVNYRMADDLDWGKNLGCMFAKRSCRTWMKNQLKNNDSPSPFCFQPKQKPLHTRCTHSDDAIALCNLEKYSSNLPEEYQYFNHLSTNDASKDLIADATSYGGSVVLADYCPFYQKFSLKNSVNEARETVCRIPENSPNILDNFALESYGENSKCVEQANEWTAKKGRLTRTMLDWGSGCYEYLCEDGTLYILVAGKKYQCIKRGHVLHINNSLGQWSINGSLRCPDCERFCPGSCMSKKQEKIAKLEVQFVEISRINCSSHTKFVVEPYCFYLLIFIVVYFH